MGSLLLVLTAGVFSVLLFMLYSLRQQLNYGNVQRETVEKSLAKLQGEKQSLEQNYKSLKQDVSHLKQEIRRKDNKREEAK